MSSLTSRLRNPDRRLFAAIAGLVVLVLVAATIGAVYAYRQSAPTTVSFNLKSEQKEVPLDQKISITFTRPVHPEAVVAHFHLSPAIEGKLEASAGSRSYTWVPAAPWADLAEYTLSVDGFSDGGHEVRGGRLRFTTTIVPRVVNVATDAGAGVADGADIPVGSKLVLAFNSVMDQTTVRLTVNGSPGQLAWAQDGRSASLDTSKVGVGPLALAFVDGGRDTGGHLMQPGWKLGLNVVFRINVHTTPLKYPALVQIPNDPTARDQSGLQSADTVFEYGTEGGITRFTAVFTHVPDKVGPVRSGRLISIPLVRHYRGLLFLSGVSQGTFGAMRAAGMPGFFDTAGYYYRTSDRFPPNNLYINADAISRAEASYNLAAYTPPTGSPRPSGGSPAGRVGVDAHRSAYDYDPITRTYTKTEDGHRFSDAAIGQPLRISMLVVMHTRVTTTGIIEDVNGAHGLDYDMDSGGRAEIYYQGQAYGGRWSAPDRSSPFAFTLDNGTQVPVPPGLVWVDVVP